MLAALTFIVFPLTPDRVLHEHLPINLHSVVRLVIVVSIIQAMGYFALRTMGNRMGVPLAGMVSGFVSSMATHAAMGARAREHPANSAAYASAAALSNVATALQAIFITATIAPSILAQWWPYLLSMATAALGCGIFFYRQITECEAQPKVRLFRLAYAVYFAALFGLVTAGCEFARTHWGEHARWAAAALSSIVDVHVAVASLASVEKSTAAQAATPLLVPLLICLSINASMKAIVALIAAGKSRFSAEISASLLLISATPWCLWLFIGRPGMP